MLGPGRQRMGVWACGRIGVWADSVGPAGSAESADSAGSAGFVDCKAERQYADTPIRRHAHTPIEIPLGINMCASTQLAIGVELYCVHADTPTPRLIGGS